MLTIRLVSEMLYETAYKHSVKFVREFVFSYLSARFRREFPLSCRPLWGYMHSSGLSPFPSLTEPANMREENETERGGEDTNESGQFIDLFQVFETFVLSALLSSRILM